MKASERLEDWPVLGEVPHESLDLGAVPGNGIHPRTQEALEKGELEIVATHSEPGLEGYALIVRRIKKPAIIVGVAAGIAAGAIIAIKGARRLRER